MVPVIGRVSYVGTSVWGAWAPLRAFPGFPGGAPLPTSPAAGWKARLPRSKAAVPARGWLSSLNKMKRLQDIRLG